MINKKIPWRRKWQPTPVSLTGKSHEQRSLAAYNPWGFKESDMTEKLNHSNSMIKCMCFKKSYGGKKLTGLLKGAVTAGITNETRFLWDLKKALPF